MFQPKGLCQLLTGWPYTNVLHGLCAFCVLPLVGPHLTTDTDGVPGMVSASVVQRCALASASRETSAGPYSEARLGGSCLSSRYAKTCT